MPVTFPLVCQEKSCYASRGGRNCFQKAALTEPAALYGAEQPQHHLGHAGPLGPGHTLVGGSHATGTGRHSLHSIVFLNAFMNNSKRKYYSLDGSQRPAQCSGVGLGAAKANTLPAPLLFLPVFQINRCLSHRALRPLLPD